MSCSKRFLPELTIEVTKYLQNDYSTLYSCILVNRFWCHLATPLLWENPFSIRTENYNFIEIYLQFSNDDFKTKLKEYNIINNSLSSKTLFNYPSFLKYLNIHKLIISVQEWYDAFNIKASKSENSVLDLDFKRLICISLFRIFIENEVNLYTLEIEIDFINNNCYYPCLNDILELILQNTNFIHNIRNLNFFIESIVDYSREFALTKYRILQIINLHQNLKKILLGHDNLHLYQELLSSEDLYNCSNTLNTIIFYCINFNYITNLNRIFDQLNGLKSVHIIDCLSLNNYFAQQIINLTKPFKLKSLSIREISESEIESLKLLIQKSCDYLENFGYGGSKYEIYDSLLEQQILGLIITCCKNIKFLNLIIDDNQQKIYQEFNLIENIKQNLNYLSITINNIECSSILLQNLGQTIPSKLEYLHLYLNWIRECDIEVFLKNSQDTFIKKLLIRSIYNQKDILPTIKKYLFKKRRVKYLAIDVIYNMYDKISFSLKDETKEFKLNDVIVQSYHSLVINKLNFIKEVY
ncbi:uncharacterized protein OCT59_023925 [Rhizophagus irregularis]|uniref:F-box domain-containing protein n=2 Tax=Rhizophagus irregularis (strain DAOM 181602 / DAOM 197198 / MUCL 43194) TaxID=747089 RepID=A0A2H5RV99_RHIID|nr:hypothetical protein GLOIN_2v1778366 [Rhizophagus irregularis DAOM 181602=DAOM 197198]POG68369.1 hypothetical protein GLOIN_2v1778366 [Rhizophagus irregularis DAOM 181602=DAOM 197198]UZO03518.1 hypothetical protein OCT59_023925 [Rhizophagus irregularis]GBC22014.1 hypothetical protein GLOIN_2v1778366 [Rhizophagus irregularis DAOM 181602=DAOM 197198]|eukprot:XP_025175235.1 hypothetical protein GLOIN_2v1778366 [Rhizophagus irregularis DAOM 181602=DAOM 197198]